MDPEEEMELLRRRDALLAERTPTPVGHPSSAYGLPLASSIPLNEAGEPMNVPAPYHLNTPTSGFERAMGMPGRTPQQANNNQGGYAYGTTEELDLLKRRDKLAYEHAMDERSRRIAQLMALGAMSTHPAVGPQTLLRLLTTDNK